MARRRVTNTGKDHDGNITRLCNVNEFWCARTKAAAIRDIDSREHCYFVRDDLGNEVEIRVVDDPAGRYLRTNPDDSGANNLDDLPNC